MTFKLPVLVAEGEPEVRRALIEALQGLYEVRVAGSADDLRAALQNEKYFLAFIGDGFTGFDLSDALEFTRENGLITSFIGVFTRPNPVRDAELKENGAEATITYPFSARLVRIEAERARKEAIRRIQISELIGQLKSLYLSILGYDIGGIPFITSLPSLAKSNEPLLIIGERGAGKALLARAIHLAGRRPLGPFEVVNTRRIPRDELGSALFGAPGCRGAIEKASGGSTFIRGVGETSPFIQERLLGIIREGRADVRFIFSTRLDLHGAALRGEFSGGLWAILEPTAVNLPALRERPETIPMLAQRLLDQYAERLSSPARGFHRSALDLLASYSWPGNLIELERAIVLAAARASGPLLVAEDLVEIQSEHDPLSLDQLSLEEILYHKLKPLVNSVDELSDADLHELVISRVERPLIRLVMNKVGGNQIKAARALGIHRNTLSKKLGRLGIKSQGE